jgi:hypothetical protein
MFAQGYRVAKKRQSEKLMVGNSEGAICSWREEPVHPTNGDGGECVAMQRRPISAAAAILMYHRRTPGGALEHRDSPVCGLNHFVRRVVYFWPPWRTSHDLRAG